MYTFSQRSQDNLKTCQQPLKELFNEVIKHRDCSILEGYRGEEEQNKAVEEGRSYATYPNSAHNQLPSPAVDVMPYPIDWNDKEGQLEFATFVFDTAMKMNIRVRWGGQFKKKGKKFYDAPHWELIND